MRSGSTQHADVVAAASHKLFVQQPSVMEDDELPQLGDAPPTSPLARIPEADAEEYRMMKRWLDPLCTIGTGAFGRVQLCQHRQNGKYYALKSMLAFINSVH